MRGGISTIKNGERNFMKSSISVEWIHPGNSLGSEPTVEGLGKVLAEAGQRLAEISTSDIVKAFDDLSSSLLDRGNPLLGEYPASGLPFLGRMCRSEGFSKEVADALGGLDCLDQYVRRDFVENVEKRAYPRGIIGHWVAGNVPTLALISLLSALMTKNANLVRLPSAANSMLPDLLRHFHGLGEVHAAIAEAVAVVRYDYAEVETAEKLSLLTDSRIIWGGDESSAKIKQLPCKLGCQEMVFPDRTSFAVVGKGHYSGERASATARLLAHDIAVFEQKACASPHTVFVSTDSDQELEDFCRVLFDAMTAVTQSIPKMPPAPKEVSAILNLRNQYDMFNEAWYPDEVTFTILSDEETKLGPAIGNRTIFVRKLPAVEALADIIPSNIQSVGIAAGPDEFASVTEVLGRAGVHRFTPLGAMTHFSLPWDGMFIPQLLVRWVVRPSDVSS